MQVSLQVHSLYGNPACAKVALSQLASRPNDEIGQVHIWYWGGAVAMHLGQWQRSMMLFRAAACSTQQYPHASMRAKALVGIVEAMLAALVSQHCPELRTANFQATVLQSGSVTLADVSDADMVHSQLCDRLRTALPFSSEDFSGEGNNFHYTVNVMKQHIQHALLDAHAVGDDGVELRALLLAQFILKVEGDVTWDHGLRSWQWNATARPTWLLQDFGNLIAVQGRFKVLMQRLARNVFVTRKLLGCHVVLDPRSHVEMHMVLEES